MSEEQKKIKLFEKDYLDIPFSMMSEDDIIICFDPQKRLGEKTWSVLIYHGPDFPEAKGLFWEKDDAVNFAEKVRQEDIALTAEQKAMVLRLCEEVLDMLPNYNEDYNRFECISCMGFVKNSDTEGLKTRESIFNMMNHDKECFIKIAKQLKEELQG